MAVLGVGVSTLVVLVLLLMWLQLNRCLSLVGSALLGALVSSAAIDALWSWGSDAGWLSVATPTLLVLGALLLMRWQEILPTRRWVAFGLVTTFVVRAVVMAPIHRGWSGRLSGDVHDWLVMAGLDPSALPPPEELPPRILGNVEMPCGLDRFRVRSDDLKTPPGSLRLRIEACGFSPQAFRAQGSQNIEISNALAVAVQISFAPQDEDGEYFSTWSVVVPPESSIEVPDFKVPVGGAVLIYAPLEPRLGVVFGSGGQVPGEFWISRSPLLMKRQVSDTP